MEVTEGMLNLFKVWCQRDPRDVVRTIAGMLPGGELIPGACDDDYMAFTEAIGMLKVVEVRAIIWATWEQIQARKFVESTHEFQQMVVDKFHP